MAKSVHSKRRKANKSLQRRVIWETSRKEVADKVHERLMKRTFGKGDDDYIQRKKSAFRFPNDPTAEFPQAPKPVHIEKRSAYVPMSLRTKVKGIKACKIESLRKIEEVNAALKKAEERFENTVNNTRSGNDMTIELHSDNKFNDKLDRELKALEKMNIENDGKTSTVRNKKKKKSKSHYIINH